MATTPKWRNKKISDEQHVHLLESESAKHGEDSAYSSYKRNQHHEAAAHHLMGAHRMVENGRPLEAQRHRMMYEAHLGALGLRPGHKVDKQIAALSNGSSESDSLFFTHHPADKMI